MKKIILFGFIFILVLQIKAKTNDEVEPYSIGWSTKIKITKSPLNCLEMANAVLKRSNIAYDLEGKEILPIDPTKRSFNFGSTAFTAGAGTKSQSPFCLNKISQKNKKNQDYPERPPEVSLELKETNVNKPNCKIASSYNPENKWILTVERDGKIKTYYFDFVASKDGKNNLCRLDSVTEEKANPDLNGKDIKNWNSAVCEKVLKANTKVNKLVYNSIFDISDKKKSLGKFARQVFSNQFSQTQDIIDAVNDAVTKNSTLYNKDNFEEVDNNCRLFYSLMNAPFKETSKDEQALAQTSTPNADEAVEADDPAVIKSNPKEETISPPQQTPVGTGI